MSIVDAYERRSNKHGQEHKVIGTLLGFYDKRVIEITGCFAVPFSEAKDEPEINVAYNKDMFEMIQRAVPTEIPVGWFSTSPDINEYSLSYHDYYADFARAKQGKRDQPPVALLTVDTTLQSGRMGIKAYLRTKAGIPGAKEPHCAIFMPINVEIATFDAEQVALEMVMKGTESKNRQIFLKGGAEHMAANIEQMLQWIDRIRKYIDDVLAGKEVDDPAVGRKLMSLANSVTKVNPQQFENLLSAGMKDYLMVSYLAQLAKTQLNLNKLLVTQG